MSNLHLNSRAGKASAANNTPTHEKTGLFFPQFIPVPGALGQLTLMVAPGSGIPMRDYFAAHALATCNNSWDAGFPDTANDVANWCYRIADAMLKERELRKEQGFPPVDEKFLPGNGK